MKQVRKAEKLRLHACVLSVSVGAAELSRGRVASVHTLRDTAPPAEVRFRRWWQQRTVLVYVSAARCIVWTMASRKGPRPARDVQATAGRTTGSDHSRYRISAETGPKLEPKCATCP